MLHSLFSTTVEKYYVLRTVILLLTVLLAVIKINTHSPHLMVLIGTKMSTTQQSDH